MCGAKVTPVNLICQVVDKEDLKLGITIIILKALKGTLTWLIKPLKHKVLLQNPSTEAIAYLKEINGDLFKQKEINNVIRRPR